MSSFACENIHQGHERINDKSRGRKEINLCLAALLCNQLLPIREWRCQDIDQVLLHGRCFLSSASSSTEVPGQNRCAIIWVDCRLQLAGFGRMWKRCKLATSDSKCASFIEANHSTVKSKDSYFHMSSSPVEANNKPGNYWMRWAWYHELSKPRSVLSAEAEAEADNTDTRFW